MIPLINQAVMMGYAAPQILQFIAGQLPQFSAGIKSAQKLGHSAENILSFLSNKIPVNKQRAENQISNTDNYLRKNGLTTKSERDEKNAKRLKFAVGVGSGALAAYTAIKSLPNAMAALQNLGSGGPGNPGTPNGNPPAGPPNAGAPNGPVASPQQPQGSGPVIPQPGGPSPQVPPIIPPATAAVGALPSPTEQGLEGLDLSALPPNRKKKAQELLTKIQDLTNAGVKPQDASMKMLTNRLQKVTGNVEATPEQPQEQPQLESPSQELDALQPEAQGISEVPKGEDFESKPRTDLLDKKGLEVALPSGEVGQIESVKNGIANIKVGNTNKHRKLEELIESPLPEKELSDLYTDLLSGIEKETGQQVSRNVSWSGYDPKTNELAYIPHDGGLYIYDEISPEDAKELTSILSTRKTSGENFIGAWEAGSNSPIGAAMSKLIQRLQKERGGKGNEYKNKFEKLYDAIEPAKLALKQKKKNEKKTKKSRAN